MAAHTCVWFDDGEPELVCVCGARAVAVLEDDGETVVLVPVDDDATVTALPSPARGALAVPA